MKLAIAWYTAAFVFAPAIGLAMDQGARQHDSTKATNESYPYPDWPAITKTTPQKNTDQPKPANLSEPQKGTEPQKAAEQTGSSGSLPEPSLYEKAARELEALAGACGQLRQACLDEGDSGQGQSKCQEFRATCGSNWLPPALRN